MKTLQWWISIWDRREDPRTLALVRILLAAVVMADWIQLGGLGLVEGLFSPAEVGGMGAVLQRDPVPWLYALLPPTWAAWVGYGAAVVLTAMVGLGLGTRLAAVGLVLVWAQLALALPSSDRGIDMLIRNVLVVLALSQSHRAWSLDAWRRTGRWGGDGALVPGWPRLLLILQLVVLYFTAGVQKVASSWTPVGGFSALYIAMRDPAFATLPPALLSRVYPLTQILTAGSWLWEWSAPVLLLGLYFQDTRTRRGQARALSNRLRLVEVYLLIGASFHLGTAVSLQLGIFPWAVLALYPACFHPDVVAHQMTTIRRYLRLEP